MWAGANAVGLFRVFGVLGPGLAAVDGWLGAPLLGQSPHSPVDILVATQQVADDAAVQQGAVGIGVGQVGGHHAQSVELVPPLGLSPNPEFSSLIAQL